MFWFWGETCFLTVFARFSYSYIVFFWAAGLCWSDWTCWSTRITRRGHTRTKGNINLKLIFHSISKISVSD